MSTRLPIYELAERYRVPAAGTAELVQAAALGHEPGQLQRWLARGVAVLAAALFGLGIILWLAANWDTLGRMGRFALLQGAVLVACVAAALRPGLRAPAGLAALLATGGLFAYFGQTYQTGADAWQLFALWTVLALPLAFGARSDVVWAPWALVATTAVALWTYAHAGHRWRVAPGDLGTHATAWIALGLIAAGLSRSASRWTGAGVWSFRTAATLAVVALGASALGGLFHSKVAPHYWLGLLLLAGAGALLAQRAAFDVFALSAVALALDTLLVCGLGRALFDGHHGDWFGQFLLLGLAAAGLLAASVQLVLRLSRAYGEPEA
ncbi:DUF2157 domain-containing protein [Ramlibacter humi]|uniref:DUF2157 domain-containing protein n=1 Tax=Ramlibacter humi TaxID=2530451 RepID=A0A4Z0BQA7_9BURK|nr:DUF2157 domain-containing protein [Ramlibacter humi]TFZ00235.1 DUF2157 domain-containing protein [Ramlibacter humi]